MPESMEERLKDALRSARDRINTLQDEVDSLKASGADTQPVAVVGMSCRFPGGAYSPDTFFRLLQEGYDGVSDVPQQRFDMERWYHPRRGEAGKSYVKRGGFLTEDPGLFDAAFFRISPVEAIVMDPQQRMLLEVSWNAFEDAGIKPKSLRASNSGVFIGISSVDYLEARMCSGDTDAIDPWSSTGVMSCSAAGRLSYFYDFHGPSVSLDTACSSSLIAIQNAVDSIRAGDCNLALAGGVNLMLTPAAWVGLSALNAVSPDGRSKSFSQLADGFGRGEGCGILVLKRLEDAVNDGDCIHAVILGGAVGHGGLSNGFTSPNGPAQEMILRRALKNSGIAAEQVGFIEAHGTGTPLGDPIELDALQAVYGKRSDPLLVGSVKPNIGHLEAAAGVAGVIKAICCVRDGVIPQTTHCNPLSERMDWQNCTLQVVDKTTEWNLPQQGQRIAGISSFGISGTGAHLLLASAPVADSAKAAPMPEPVFGGAKVALLSGVSEQAVKNAAIRIGEWLNDSSDHANDIRSACIELATHRTEFPYRMTVCADSDAQLRQRFSDWAAGTSSEGIQQAKAAGSSEVVFVFSGQGSQTPQMGVELYEASQTFRQTFDRCQHVWSKYNDTPLMDVIRLSQDDSPLDQTEYTQPAIFSFQVSLAALWAEFGVKPAKVIGHSIGEYAAACVAGVFSVESAMELVIKRAKLVKDHALAGSMLAVMADHETLPQGILDDDHCVIAALNAPGQTVLAGDAAAIESAMQTCKNAGLIYKQLKVSHPFHAPMMDPVLEPFQKELQNVGYARATIPMVSTMTGKPLEDDVSWPDYFVRQMRQPVLFHDSICSALNDTHETLFLEIGCVPVLSSLLRRIQPKNARIFASQKGTQEPLVSLMNALGGLYCAGVNIDWNILFGNSSYHRSGVPVYAFDQQRYYLDPVAHMNHSTGVGNDFNLNNAALGQTDAVATVLQLQSQAMQELVQMQAAVLGAAGNA